MKTAANEPTSTRRVRRLLPAILAAGLIGVFYGVSPVTTTMSVASPTSEAGEHEQTGDLSRFDHSSSYHSRMPCLLCHRRDTNSGRIGFPGKDAHSPCAGCHAPQFADSTSPICTICHTDARTGAMKRFPPLRSFATRFEHTRHARVNCSVCHTPSRRGVALSIPSDGSAHDTCFKCHTSSSPNSFASCGTCHVEGRPNWTSESSRAYRINFSHSRHVQGARLSCAVCHTVRPGPRGRQVSSPAPAMHFARGGGASSCYACHNGTRAFGAEDFANCKRCHQGNRFRF
ncbi:MAG: cytochrome c3 family protein [Pyrinomonadaceae bacterium]